MISETSAHIIHPCNEATPKLIMIYDRATIGNPHFVIIYSKF